MDFAGIAGSGPDGLIVERDVQACLAARPKATPLASALARLHGVDLTQVSGTGTGGRVTSADLRQPGQAAPEPKLVATYQAKGDRTEKMSGMRKAVSRNMHASLQTMAQANHRMQADMSAAIALREQFKAAGVKLSFNDILIRCAAQALSEFPEMNASIEGDSIVYHGGIHIGLAVSVPGGLIVPVVRDADCGGLRGIAAQSAELIEKARAGALSNADYHGGTFTVTSLGMYDVDSFTAIINPPEAGILAVGKIVKTPVVVQDEIVVRPMCTLSLTYDHRLVDGAEAAKFLQRLKTLLQSPLLLL